MSELSPLGSSMHGYITNKGTLTGTEHLHSSQFGHYVGKRRSGIMKNNPVSGSGKHGSGNYKASHAKPMQIPQATYGKPVIKKAAAQPSAQSAYMSAKGIKARTLPSGSSPVPQGKIIPHGTNTVIKIKSVSSKKPSGKKSSALVKIKSRFEGRNKELMQRLVK